MSTCSVTQSLHDAPVRLKGRVVAITALICVGGAIAFIVVGFRNNEPRYEGKTLSQWLALYVAHANDSQGEHAELAVRAIGTNALPFLLEWVRDEQPSKWKELLVVTLERLPRFIQPQAFRDWQIRQTSASARADRSIVGFELLGPNADAAIPELARVANAANGANAPRVAVDALVGIGPAALPAVMSVVTNTNSMARFYAITSLRAFGSNATPAIPILIDSLREDDLIATAAAQTLGALQLEQEITVPALMKMVESPRPLLRLFAIDAIVAFGEQARPALLKALEDEDQIVRINATNALEMLTNPPAQ